ncbi:MAG: hypothetical protein NTW36_03320 [Planctomycetia bacterium]|jgi:hypothetical protein|nr:hypothetical protein [Planctomycetia bacterium]
MTSPRRTRVFRQPAGGGYADESSVEPNEPLSCASVVDDAAGHVVIEFARLLPPVV